MRSETVAPSTDHPANASGGSGSNLWHSQADMTTVKDDEIVIARGEGAYVWDEAGRRLLDVAASLWYCNVGHGREEIADAVAEQIRTLESFQTFGRYATRPALTLADRVVEHVPVKNAKVFFTSGGSDAVDTAAKVIWRYWAATGRPSKRFMITREKAYHGLHVFGTSIAGIEPNREGYTTLLEDTRRVATNSVEALEDAIAELGAENVAAFFVEPVVGGGGVIPPAPGYLEGVQEVCRRRDIMLVADEVIVGFGRTGKLFASERYGIEPDVLLMAKGITSGYLPLGAVAFSERLWRPFWEQPGLVFRHGLTYSAHAAACAAALANWDILERERLVDHVAELEPVLTESMNRLGAHPLVTGVRAGAGLLAGVDLVDPACADRVASAAYDAGLLIRTIGEGNTLQISPPFVVTADEVRSLGTTLWSLLDSVHAGTPGG
jgi:adenosylmethionine-8-amino-7-oxononanoate aminotransferase